MIQASLPQQQPQPQQAPEPQSMPFPGSMTMDSFFSDAMQSMFSRHSAFEDNLMMRMRQRMPLRGSYQVITFVMGPQAEEEKNPVEESTIEKLEKVAQLGDDCAVCQEQEGSGLKLNCGHEFHEHCIRPWFEEKNTCPCCRAAQ